MRNFKAMERWDSGVWVDGGIDSAGLIWLDDPQGLFLPRGFHDSEIWMENMLHVKAFRKYLIHSQPEHGGNGNSFFKDNKETRSQHFPELCCLD